MKILMVKEAITKESSYLFRLYPKISNPSFNHFLHAIQKKIPNPKSWAMPERIEVYFREVFSSRYSAQCALFGNRRMCSVQYLKSELSSVHYLKTELSSVHYLKTELCSVHYLKTENCVVCTI